MRYFIIELLAFVITLSILQSACTSQIPKIVKVPVVVASPKIAMPEKPYLPVADLTKESKPDDVMKSYVASLKLTQGYSDELRKILEAYQ